MGAWGVGPFENDDAGDWAWSFDGADAAAGLRTIREALEPVADAGPKKYIEAPDGALAVAAAEALAFALGRGGGASSYNESITGWVERTHPTVDPALIELARRALSRARAENSELRKLWDEAGDDEWAASMSDVSARLDASPS